MVAPAPTIAGNQPERLKPVATLVPLGMNVTKEPEPEIVYPTSYKAFTHDDTLTRRVLPKDNVSRHEVRYVEPVCNKPAYASRKNLLLLGESYAGLCYLRGEQK